jgi:hypothetical protein
MIDIFYDFLRNVVFANENPLLTDYDGLMDRLALFVTLLFIIIFVKFVWIWFLSLIQYVGKRLND